MIWEEKSPGDMSQKHLLNVTDKKWSGPQEEFKKVQLFQHLL